VINIDFSSGSITSDTSGAKPDIAVGTQKAGLHLTRGYVSPDRVPATTQGVSPVNLNGEVDVLVDDQTEANQVLNGSWFFGFIQVARIRAMSAEWDGRRAGEGSVDLFTAGFPVSNDIFALDSDPADQPFISRAPHVGFSKRLGQRRLVHVTATMTDHPNYRDFLVTTNSETKSRNFLHRLSFSVEFTSVFVGRDGSGPIQPIAHIKWNVDLLAELRWSRGRAVPRKRPLPSSFQIEPSSSIGAPADPSVRAIVDNPRPPFAKELAIDRWRRALSDPLTRQESSERPLLLPRDFFQ
jgi:hypothetical protein